MTAPGAQITQSASAQDVARQWHALRESGDIQFAPVAPVKPPETPQWLQWLGERLRDLLEPLGKALGMSWPTLQNILIALAALLALLVLWILLRPVVERLLNRKAAQAEPDWAPDRESAERLLADADRLADEGRYDEAVHLLLRRSVGHIAEARPDWLRPASTAREIADLPLLPDKARHAFSEIAVRVERSLFALRNLDEQDWRAARAAYADFALAELAP